MFSFFRCSTNFLACSNFSCILLCATQERAVVADTLVDADERDVVDALLVTIAADVLAVLADTLVDTDVRDVVDALLVTVAVDVLVVVADTLVDATVRDVVDALMLAVAVDALVVVADALLDAAVRAATAAAYLLYLSNMVRSSARGSTHSISISRYNASLAALNL